MLFLPVLFFSLHFTFFFFLPSFYSFPTEQKKRLIISTKAVSTCELGI